MKLCVEGSPQVEPTLRDGPDTPTVVRVLSLAMGEPNVKFAFPVRIRS